MLIDVPTPRLPRDFFLTGEGFKNIKTNGWWFGLNRQVGWLLIWLKSARRTITQEGYHYAARQRAVEHLIRAGGFQIAKNPAEFLNGTNVSDLQGLRSPDKGHPRYSWWLLRKL